MKHYEPCFTVSVESTLHLRHKFEAHLTGGHIKIFYRLHALIAKTFPVLDIRV